MTPFQWRIAFCSFLVLIAVTTKVSGAEETSSEEIPTFPPVFVTATQTEVPLKETAASVTLIDEKTIEEKHLTTVEEVLREVPGLAVVQSGGLGGTTSVFIRGTNPDHTLVLIDGVQVNSPFSGFFDFANLTVENIERIEVIRGPQSTLYGSDAVGGVIQIFTKKGQGPPTGSLSFEAGAYRTFRETAGVSGSTERFDYSLSAGRIDSQGFSRAAGGREDDGYENTTLSSRLGIDLTSQTRLEWTGRYTDSESDLDSPPDDIRNFVQAEKKLATSLTLLTTLLEGWRQELKVSFTTEELEGRDPVTSFNNYKFEAQGRRVDWRHHLDLGRAALLTLGYEYELQEGESRGGIEEESLTNHAIYAFNQFRLSPIILNLGVRYDDNDRFGNETTYKIEGAYLVKSTATKIHAAYGTGFHAPTLVDLFFPCCGNEDLNPEKSRSYEAGVEQSFQNERVRVGATYFQNRIEQLIVFDFVRSIPINLAKAKMNGWEFDISARPAENVSLSANYTLLNTEDEDGAELIRRPRYQAGGNLSVRPIHPLLLILQVRYVGDRSDFSGKMDDYTVVDLSGTYALHRNVSLFARVENLFDREYEEVIDYATAGFSGYGGVKVTF